MNVDVVSDFVCPWCFIGTRRLARALAGTDAVVVHHPFILDPSVPEAGADLRAHLAAKYRGRDPASMFAVVEGEAKKSGIPLDFSVIERIPNTIRAHTLSRHAAEKGTQLAFADAVFRAYFLEGKDIGDGAVLREIAVQHGFSAAEVDTLLASEDEQAETRGDAMAAMQQGIEGVPFFVFDNRLALEGAQPIEIFREAVRRAGDLVKA